MTTARAGVCDVRWPRRLFADDAPVTKVAATECAALGSLRLPDVAIASAEAKAPAAADRGRVKVPHCKVTGVIGTEIRFEVLLPDTWNRRFAMGGGGGFVGSVQNQVVDVVNRGYATAGTDTGHQADGLQAGWALDNPERQVNYGYLGCAPHRRGGQSDRARVLRQRQRLLLFPGVLQRRPPGA